MRNLNSVRNYLLHDWEELVTGIPLMENEEWILIQELPTDYMVDGFMLLQKNQLEDHYKNDDSNLKELVLTLKKYKAKAPTGFQLGNIDQMLRWIEKEYTLFGVQDEEEYMQIGRIQSLVANELRMETVNALGFIDYAQIAPVFLTDLQAVSFGTDYLESIALLESFRKPSNN